MALNPATAATRKALGGLTSHDILADLRGILLNSQLSYEVIGAQANVGAQTINRWVSGETKSPQLLKVLAVANVLGYDLVLVRRRQSRFASMH